MEKYSLAPEQIMKELKGLQPIRRAILETIDEEVEKSQEH